MSNWTGMKKDIIQLNMYQNDTKLRKRLLPVCFRCYPVTVFVSPEYIRTYIKIMVTLSRVTGVTLY
jgi:hypothetical protein